MTASYLSHTAAEPSTSRRGRVNLALRAAVIGLAALLVAGVAQPASAAPTAPAAAVAAAAWGGNTANPYGGKDYFVDATAGDDAAAGTSASAAWKSFTKVNATTFQPGDRILLKAGETWPNVQLWPKGSGTASKPISIDAYGDASARRPYIATNGNVQYPFVSPGVKNPDLVGLTGAVVLRNQEYWNIANLEVSNDDDFATDITTGNFVRDGIAVSINADKLAPGADTVMDGITISNVFAHDIDGPSTWQRIHYAGINFQVFGSKQYGEYAEGGYHFEDIRIENNTFQKVELHAIQFAFNWFGDKVGQTDAAGKFHEGWEQLWVRTRDLYSRDVYIGHNYAESIGQGPFQFANTQRLTAEYNEANGWLERYSQVSAGLYLWAGADSVMRFNEIHDGPANEYDATAWDLEYTNFDVLYEHNYSHDNEGGWMSYMGNSSNSIARYNLSVNDNGVIWKNMLSTNYAPTYVLNNVFVYDGAELEYFHDEVLKDRVYFANNVFYNTSTTTPTNWFRKPDALTKGVFSNNAYYEAGGTPSPKQPADDGAVTANPQFVGNPADYATNAGVDNILQSASLFKLKSTSPLIDAGRYNVRIGSEDFFGTKLYYGAGVDIGIDETEIGAKVSNPVDTDPIENEGVDTRVDLALNKPIVASTTHPANNYGYSANKMNDGDDSTRWAGADDATYPLTIDIDFGEETTFDEIVLTEFTDSGTNNRVLNYDLQRWDAGAGAWVTFESRTDGLGANKVIDGFGEITSTKLRLAILSLKPGEIYAPTISRFSVYGPASGANPVVTPMAAVMDVNASMADDPDNIPTFSVDLDGDMLAGLRYVQPSGAIVGSLDSADYTRQDAAGTSVVSLTRAFATDKELGTSGVIFEFSSGATVRVAVEIVDTTALEAALAAAKKIAKADTAAYRALAKAITDASGVLGRANRDTVASGNTSVTSANVVDAAKALAAAITAYDPSVTVPTKPGGSGGAGGSGDAGGKSGDGLPMTGAQGVGAAVIAGLLLLFAGVMLVVRRRRLAAGRAGDAG